MYVTRRHSGQLAIKLVRSGGQARRRRIRRTCARKHCAFTITEVMVVVAITGLLLSFVIPAMGKARKDVRERQAKTELEILAAGIRQLAWDTGEWPGGIARNIQGNAETWDLSVPIAGLLTKHLYFEGWDGPYVPEVTDDPWGSKYFFDPDYQVAGKTRAVVGSFGRNRAGRNRYDSDDIYIILK